MRGNQLVSAHTPGPWLVSDEYQGAHALLGVYIDQKNSGRVARTFANCLVKTDAECRANARLIAAAPDLLAALQRIAAIQEISLSVEIARAAVAKATGAA